MLDCGREVIIKELSENKNSLHLWGMHHVPDIVLCVSHSLPHLILKIILSVGRYHYPHVTGQDWALEQLSSSPEVTLQVNCAVQALPCGLPDHKLKLLTLESSPEIRILSPPKSRSHNPTPHPTLLQTQKTEQIVHGSNFAEGLVETFYIRGKPLSPTFQGLGKWEAETKISRMLEV